MLKGIGSKQIASLAALALLVGVAATARAATDCEAARCAAQSALEQCSCTGATNHGQYVSCVAHVVNGLAKDGTIPTYCKGKIKRCAAKSTCGKDGFVTCQIPKVGSCGTPCTADPTATCCEDATTACTVDTDCVVNVCKIKSTDIRCTEAGGTVGTATTCCAPPNCVP
jgi:hypothetical protein